MDLQESLSSDARPSKSLAGLRIVAALGRRGEIGREGGLLFRLKADMAHFRAVTAGKPVVMGRKTWESLPRRPLPGRPNIIATRNLQFLAPEAFVYSSLPPAMAAAQAMATKSGASEACIIGGAEIYAAAMQAATAMTLTEVDAEAEADAYFPDFDRGLWREVSAVTHAADAGNEAAFVIREYERRE